MKTQKIGILLKSCKSDSTRQHQMVIEQVSSSSKHLKSTQSLLEMYLRNSEWIAEWHEEEIKNSFHDRQLLPIPPDLCLICFI